MLYRITFGFFGTEIKIVTNAKYIADFMSKELKNSYVTQTSSILSNDNGYIEKVIAESQIGVAIVPGQTIEGSINYYGVEIPFLQITTFDNMQPIRVFLNSVVAEVLKDRCIPIHASTVSNNEKAFAFSGDKNSGKSTLSISQVLWKDCLFVSDDVTFVGIDNNHNVVCDGIFNGVHIFEGEKYIYKNKMFYSGRDSSEYLKRRMIFKSNFLTQNPIELEAFLFPTINDDLCRGNIEPLSINEARIAIRNNMIRFGVCYSDSIDNTINTICERTKMFGFQIGVNFLESMEFVYDSFVNT